MAGRVFADQIGRLVNLPEFPLRIISLVPSITELLYDLNLGDRVVGVTKFCTYPRGKTAVKIGGTKNVDINLIRQLQPDLIVASKEENVEEQILELADNFPVWVSDVHDLPSALAMIKCIGEITAMTQEADSLVQRIEDMFREGGFDEGRSVVYLIWKDPIMVAGADTYISDMLGRAGFKNAITDTRYPVMTEKEIATIKPDIILLSTEPYPFAEKHRQYYSEIWPESQIEIVDGEMFSWYGSRLLLSAAYFKDLDTNFRRKEKS